LAEETNEMPPRLGTIYRNKGVGGNWNEYKMVEFEQDKTFTLSRLNGDYNVRYSFEPVDDGGSDFEYFKWADTGELDDTISQDVLVKLKACVEQ
jgi:hypothetical protein